MKKAHDRRDAELLDQVTDEIRRESIDPEEADRAVERVWRRLSDAVHADHDAGSCLDFREMMNGYLSGDLSQGQVLLLEDHTVECLACRLELKTRRAEKAGAAALHPKVDAPGSAPASVQKKKHLPLALAASLLLAFCLSALYVVRQERFIDTPSIGQIDRIEGRLLLVGKTGIRTLSAGDHVATTQAIRTTKQARASLSLDDGSTIEMNERTEIYLTRQERGTTIHLARGDIIIDAAPQRTGLFVKTGDLAIKVTGTVFTVSAGIRGSRVAVLEGDVEVQHGGQEERLLPGQQLSTDAARGQSPLAEDIAWSDRAEVYLALLREISSVNEVLSSAPPPRPLPQDSEIPDLLPEGTFLYVSFPNLSGEFETARALLEGRISANPLLQTWWREHVADLERTNDFHIDAFLDGLEGLASHLGDEVVVAVATDREGRVLAPVVISEVGSRGDELLGAVTDMEAMLGIEEGLFKVVTGDPAAQRPDEGHAFIMVRHGYFVSSFSLPAVEMFARTLDRHVQGETAPFEGSAFYNRIVESYRDNPSWFLSVDLESLLVHEAPGQNEEGERNLAMEYTRRIGLLDLSTLALSRDDGGMLSAVFTFKDDRRGIASWMAAPAPMGSLDFISPEAVLFNAMAVKDATAMLEDIIQIVEAVSPGIRSELAEAERKYGIDIARDLAEPLGGEVALALDGPLLPVPAWKLIFEVYDPDRLQRTLEHVIELVNQDTADPDERLTLEAHAAGGRILHELRGLGRLGAIWYVDLDGFMVATSSRTYLEQAIQVYESGHSIQDAARLRALLPRDGRGDFSFLAYQDLASLIAPLAASRLESGKETLTEDQATSLETWASEASGSILYAYAETDRIELHLNTPEGGVDRGAVSLIALTGLSILQDLIEMREEAHSVP